MTNFLDDFVNSGSKDNRLDVDLDTATAYDADTLKNVEGASKKGVRIVGVDAPEAPTIKFREGRRPSYLEGLFHEEHTAQLEDAIENQGYDQIRDTGELDAYGRTLGHLENEYGYDFAEDYLREGLIGPSRFAIDNVNLALAHAQGQMDNFVHGSENMPDWRKAEIITAQVQNVVPLGPIDLSNAGVFSTPDRRASTGSFDFLESIEYWWMSNKVAYQGLASLFDQDGAKKRIEDINLEFGDRIDPSLVVSLEQVDSATDGLAWLGNNIIIQGPDFAIIAGGGAAGAKAGAAVGSLFGGVGAVPGAVIGGFIGSTIGLGYTWLKGTGTASAEIIETTGEVNVGKAAGIGTAIALLDRFGAKAVVKPSEFLEEGGTSKLIDFVAKKDGISVADAAKKVDKEAAGIMRKWNDDIDLLTEDFVSKKTIALRIARETAVRGALEGATELSQESIQYLAIHGVPETAAEWKEMGFRLADAAAAGSAIGAAYNVPQSLKQRAEIEDWRRDTLPFDRATAKEHEKRAYDAQQMFGFEDIEVLIDDYRGQVAGETIHSRAAKSADNYLVRAGRKIKRGQFKLGGSAIQNTFHRGVLYDPQGNPIEEGFIMANAEGAMQNISGHSLFNAEEQRVARIRKNNPWLEDPKKYLGLEVEQTDELLGKLYRNGLKLDQTITKDEEAAAKMIIAGLTNTNQDLISWRGFQREDAFAAMDQPVNLLEADLPNLKKLRSNSEEAINKIAALEMTVRRDGHKGKTVGKELASELVENVLNFKDPRETSKMLHDLQVFRQIPEIYSDSAVDRLADKITHQTRSDTQTQFRGYQMEVYSNMLNSMERKGVHPDIVNELAADLLDQEAKHSKTFGRLQNDKLRIAQDYARTATTAGVMDMSFFAQPAEAVLAATGTDKTFVHQLGSVAYGMFESNKALYDNMVNNEIAGNYKEYQELGYSAEEVIQQHGVEFDSRINSGINKYLFRAFQTAQAADGIRLSRKAVAVKVISNLASKFIGKDLNNLSVKDQRLLERIQYYGGDPETLVSSLEEVGTLDPKEIEKMVDENPESLPEAFERLFDQWDAMTPKFIDEFAVRVKPGSRPSWFEDKRFGLPFLTQYLSFTAHWSTNQLPRFYNAYARSGGTLAFNTFALGASAIVVAYYSQFLKDWLIHGEESPYLKDKTGAIERALMYSGLFGWKGEAYDRFISGPYGFGAAHQALQNKDKTLVGELFGSLLESPTISHGEKIGEKIMEGDYKGAGERGLPFGNVTLGTGSTYLDYLFDGE